MEKFEEKLRESYLFLGAAVRENVCANLCRLLGLSLER
jgi:hypothetical protein